MAPAQLCRHQPEMFLCLMTWPVKPDIYASLVGQYCRCFGATGMWGGGFISLQFIDTSNSNDINWLGFHGECIERNKNTGCRAERLESCLKLMIVRPNKHCVVDFWDMFWKNIGVNWIPLAPLWPRFLNEEENEKQCAEQYGTRMPSARTHAYYSPQPVFTKPEPPRVSCTLKK